MTLPARGAFRGFEILSRGRGRAILVGSEGEGLPELLVRGAGTYAAQLNAENPLGTMQSIEYALRSLDKAVADEKERAAHCEKMLADYREHEARFKDLLARQARLNATLDLDKGERQVAPPASEPESGLEDNERGGVDEETGGVAPRARRESPCPG